MKTEICGLAAAWLITGLVAGVPALAAPIQMVASGTVDTSTYAGAPVGSAWTFTLVFDPNDRGPNVFAPPSANNASYQLFGTTASLTVAGGSFANSGIKPTRYTGIREYAPGAGAQDAVIFGSNDGADPTVFFFLEVRNAPELRNSLLPFTTAAQYQAFFDSATYELANFCFQNCSSNDGIVRFLARSIDWRFTDVGAPPAPGVPEPDTVALLGLGLAGLVVVRRRG